MKKIKALLTATAIFCIVGGSLALRPQSVSRLCIESDPGSGICDQLVGLTSATGTVAIPIRPPTDGRCPPLPCTGHTFLIPE